QTVFARLALAPESCAAERLEEVDLGLLATRFRAMAAAPERYPAWAQMARLDRQLRDAGLAELGERLRAGELDAEAATTELRFARAEQIWQELLSQRPQLQALASENRHKLVALFA